MSIFNLGSINIDLFYYVDHLPGAGETLAANDYQRGLGGKGANQSVAAALAGAKVCHMGAIGSDGEWTVARLKSRGIDVSSVATVEEPTGNATILVDATGENAIVLHPGANRTIPTDVLACLEGADGTDILLLQNETNLTSDAAARARSKGARVLYSAAPFDVAAVRAVLDQVSILLLNEVEARQLTRDMGCDLLDVPVDTIVMTKGAEGAELIKNGTSFSVPAYRVDAVDTTGAGDCFAGYFAAGLGEGMSEAAAIALASAASAIKVTRRGTSDVFPTRKEVDQFLAQNA